MKQVKEKNKAVNCMREADCFILKRGATLKGYMLKTETFSPLLDVDTTYKLLNCIA